VDESFDVWYSREHPRVLSASVALSGDADAAREATDEAFARAIDHWGSVSDMAVPGAWAQRVALNCLRRALRRRRLERLVHWRSPAPVEPPLVNPELWAAVRALPERQRLAVVLRYVSDLTEQQVAEVMGVRRGTVASTLAAARARLAGTLCDDDVSSPIEEVPHG